MCAIIKTPRLSGALSQISTLIAYIYVSLLIIVNGEPGFRSIQSYTHTSTSHVYLSTSISNAEVSQRKDTTMFPQLRISVFSLRPTSTIL